MSLFTSIPLSSSAAERIMPRIDQLALISETPGELTRRFATVQHQQANELVGGWMRDADMTVSVDAIGNVLGRYEASSPDASAILLGSHLDTVINAGKFDGMLGVLCALACVESLHEAGIRLPFAIEVVGFADEEGVRYQSTYLGSRALCGNLDSSVLARLDKDNIALGDALAMFDSSPAQLPSAKREAHELRAYFEVHIEQGPVLESKGLPVGVVTSIAGATRLNVTLKGSAGHAGTVPMDLRRDALLAAAKCVLCVQEACSGQPGLVGTVGALEVKPGAGNVIPGDVQFSVDIRAALDTDRQRSVERVKNEFSDISLQNNVELSIEQVHEAASIDCDPHLVAGISTAIESQGLPVISLPSGAGHDAAAMASLTKVGMIFVRCAGGVSHNPAESVTTADAKMAAQVLLEAVFELCQAEKA
jgi:allantoate deiminase